MNRPSSCGRCTRRRARTRDKKVRCAECRRAWSEFQRARVVLRGLGYRIRTWDEDQAPAVNGRAWLYHSQADGALRIIERDREGRILAVRQWAT